MNFYQINKKMKTENINIIPNWRKSKDEIWSEVFADIENVKVTPKKIHVSMWKYVSVAAIVAIIAGISFAYFYTNTETAASGTRLSLTLPDGSNVNLNAESEIKYKPLWRFVSREVTLNGEACFEVQQGRRFTVKSGQNKAIVIGTSFNVFARPEKYSVTCLSGKVEVATKLENVMLTPNMQVTLRNDILKIAENIDAQQSISWIKDKFIFNGVPLSDVVKEIERQYGIHIVSSSNLDYYFTGNFSKSTDPEEVLQIIGKPFDITFSIKKY